MDFWQGSAVVIAFLSWLSSPPASLGEVAKREAVRREMSGTVTKHLTNQDLSPQATAVAPPAAPPAAAATDTEDEKPATPPAAAPAPATDAASDVHGEQWWRDRISKATDQLAQDQVLAESLQSRINALTADWINRDDPGQKAVLFEQRQKALAELDRMTKQVADDKKAIDDITDDGRKQGVPPGWLRVGGL